MRLTKSTIWAFILLLITASLYRVWDSRPYGFAPQVAMAIFGGAVIKDRKLAFLLPLLSMLLSDVLYQALYMNGLSEIKGFYKGQWVTYALFAGLTSLGMLMRKINVRNVLGFTMSGSVLFFLFSNLAVWLGGGGLGRPRTFDGLMLCYGDALAFYRDYGLIKGFYANPMIGDLFFSSLIFGAFYLVTRFTGKPALQAA